MIILHPDGTYEVCALQPAVARWIRGVSRRARAMVRPGAHQAGGCADDCSLADDLCRCEDGGRR